MATRLLADSCPTTPTRRCWSRLATRYGERGERLGAPRVARLYSVVSLPFLAPCQPGRLLAFLTPCVLTSLLLCLACCPPPVPPVPASLRRPVCPFLPCWPPPSFDPLLRPLPDSPAVPPCALAIGRSEARLPLAPWTTPALSTCPWTWPTRRPSRPGLGELRQSTGGWTCWSLMRASWDGAPPTPVSR